MQNLTHEQLTQYDQTPLTAGENMKLGEDNLPISIPQLEMGQFVICAIQHGKTEVLYVCMGLAQMQGRAEQAKRYELPINRWIILTPKRS